MPDRTEIRLGPRHVLSFWRQGSTIQTTLWYDEDQPVAEGRLSSEEVAGLTAFLVSDAADVMAERLAYASD